MRAQKNLNLKQYLRGIGQFLLTSQDVYANPENIIRLKKFQIQIETRKQKKIHYVYLWLLTKTLPSLRKFYPSWKNTSKNLLWKPRAKNHSLQVTVPSKNSLAILHEILYQIISKQNNSEKKVLTFQQHVIKVMISSAAVTPKTYLLQTKNTYFPNIPLILKFQFSKTTAFQKLFFLRFLKIVSPALKLPALDQN